MISDGRELARRYLRGWFTIDVLSCIPVTYVMLLLNPDGGSGAASSTKTIKILRLLRLGNPHIRTWVAFFLECKQ